MCRTTIALTLFAVAGSAKADTIKLYHQGAGGVGHVEGLGFHRLFTIIATAETDDIVDLGDVLLIKHTSASIDIFGRDVYAFTGPTTTFLNSALARGPPRLAVRPSISPRSALRRSIHNMPIQRRTAALLIKGANCFCHSSCSSCAHGECFSLVL